MPEDRLPAPTYYRRPLPESHVAFASAEGRALFAEAMADGTIDGYFAIAEQFHTQAEPAFCGLGSLVVALNALAIDPGRSWKGPWRWFGEEMLDCCIPLDEVRRRGLTLDEIACLARCNGARVDVARADTSDIAAFRAAIGSNGGDAEPRVVIASYSRAAVGQTGTGHFSPIAGWHRGRDLALLMDVARFKYPPHWVPVSQLWEAMRTVDPDTQRVRGFLTLRRGGQAGPSIFRLRPSKPWPEVFRAFTENLGAQVGLVVEGDVVLRLTRAIGSLESTLEVVDTVAAAPEHVRHRETLLATIRRLPFFPRIVEAVDALAPSGEPLAHERVAVLLLVLAACDPLLALSPEARAEAAALVVDARRDAPLAAELDAMGSQLTFLRATACSVIS